MNTRRIPFQFSTTDPVARQRELEKRFGLQPTCPKMYVDVNKPLSMSASPKETSSPRLQHRVPIFAEGYDQPIHSSSVDSMASVPDNKKPNVRIIPIEVEGVDRSQRHRTYSGPAKIIKDQCDDKASERTEISPLKKLHFKDIAKSTAEPRVYNIPIQIEGVNTVSKSRKIGATSTANRSAESKLPAKVKSPKMQPELDQKQVDHPKNEVEILLKKIGDVLTEFKTYETEVIQFTGTSKDKQYRYLDEMLTRCMLRLDDIDTMGNEEVRLARKSAVKKIQASIDLLESKANVEPITSTEVQVQSVPVENNDVEKNDNDVEMNYDNVKESTFDPTEMDFDDIQDQSFDATVDSDIQTEVGNKVESPDQKSSDSTSVEMSEIKDPKALTENTSVCESPNLDVNFEEKTNNLSVADKAEDMMQSEKSSSFSQQLENMSKVEIPEEISLDKVNSANDYQSPELSSCGNKSAEDSKTFLNQTNDVEMLDEKDSVSDSVEVPESLSVDETTENKLDVNKSSKISEVDMIEIEDISSKESAEQNESEANEKTALSNSAFSEEITGCNIDNNMKVSDGKECNDEKIVVSAKDTEMKNIPIALNVAHDLSEEDVTCASSQSDKGETLNIETNAVMMPLKS